MSAPPFRFVQLDFGGALGPDDGRYLVRDDPGADPRRVVVLSTVTAAPRRPRRARRTRTSPPAAPPTARATLIDPAPLASAEDAATWLAGVRSKSGALERAVEDGVRELNAILRAHRAAADDPHVASVSVAGALAARVGHGTGDEVADGRFTDAYELPAEARRRSRSPALGPQERLARVLGGHEEVPVSEELILRARADLAAGRAREAALQARVALEALLVELEAEPGSSPDRGALAEVRDGVRDAASAALVGEVPEGARTDVGEAVRLMSVAVRRRALGASQQR